MANEPPEDQEPEPDGDTDTTPTPAEPSKDGSTERDKKSEEKSEKDGDGKEEQDEDDLRAAQGKAADPESAESWGRFSDQVDTAVRSLLGWGTGGLAGSFGTANFFLGETSVGQVGDRHGATGYLDVDLRLRSGEVPGPVLERIEQSYVEPEGYAELRYRLEQRQVLIIQAKKGTGRTTTALRLLNETCRAGVRKLDPDRRLKDLTAKDLEPACGYLLESLDPRQAAEFRAFHAEQLEQAMRDQGCMLVVIVDESVRLLESEIGDFVVTGFGRIRPKPLLERYLAWELAGSTTADRELLTRPDVREIVEQLGEELPPRELARLGRLLIDVANNRLDLAYVRDRYSQASSADFSRWFDALQDSDQRAFVIALAVFNDESVQTVATAARMLADRFRRLEAPRREDRARRVFATQLSERVESARAEFADSTQDTNHGQVQVRKLRFRDDRFPVRVLDWLRLQYTDALDIVLDWLFDLGGDDEHEVRARVGVAVGALSQYDFTYVFNRMILRWAGSGNAEERRAAVAALRVPGQLPELEHVVSRVLKQWAERGTPALRATAAEALGSMTSISTRQALKLMRKAAQPTTAYSVGVGLNDLFLRSDPGQVLDALVRWSDDGRPPDRRDTALLTVLIISRYVVRVETSSERWPVLLWLAEQDDARRTQILVLFSRMLQTADLQRYANQMIKDWVQKSGKDRTIAEPLARLLHDIGRYSGDLAGIRYDLEHWAGARQSTTAAARTVLRLFDEEEEKP
ncbi:hypothetical protein OHS58_24585 [Amycolatopsis sp. NBC_00348]|uniref:hypothetical protein n=1 Tax=Amycolatopsis sp. NBC_00348 TaxID=2975956 RepID=UPI002E265032